MRVEYVDIKGFGKISKKTFAFQKGINVVYGKNEAGKSTLQEFIRAMFFSNRTLRANDYVNRYKPWNTDIFGGTLHYQLDNGERFRIERRFDQGVFKIFDARYTDISGNFDIRKEKGNLFARKQFGIDEQIFDQTVFVRQMKSKLTNGSRKDLIESATNLFQTGSEEISLGDILEELNDILKRHVGNSRTKQKPLEEIQESLLRCEQEEKRLRLEKEEVFAAIPRQQLQQSRQDLLAVKRLLEWVGELIQKRKELQLLKDKKASMEDAYQSFQQRNGKDEVAQTQEQKNAIELTKEKAFLEESLAQKYAELYAMENELEVHRNFMKRVEENREALEAVLGEPIDGLESNLQSLEENDEVSIPEEHNGVRTREEHDGVRTREEHEETNVHQGIFIKFLRKHWDAVATLLAAVSAFALKSKFPVLDLWKVVLGGGVLYLTIHFLIRRILAKRSSDPSLNQENEVLQKIGLSSLKDYYKQMSQYQVMVYKFERLNDEIVEIELRMGRIERVIEEAAKSQEALQENEHSAWQNEVKGIQQKVRAVVEEVSRKEIDFYKRVNAFKGQAIRDELLTQEECAMWEGDIEVENLLTIENLFRGKSSELEKEVIGHEKDMEIARKDVQEIELLLMNLAQKKADLEKEEARLHDIQYTVGTAMQNIQLAGENMKNNTIPLLSQNFGDIVQRVTNGKYWDVLLDESYRVKAMEPMLECIVDAALLSGGTIEQIHLALRLSIAQSITKGKERLPVLLDEVFAYYDDERTMQSYRMLKDFYEQQQVILFTCKNREVEIAEEIFNGELNIIELPA